jgi:hypothetical protein
VPLSRIFRMAETLMGPGSRPPRREAKVVTIVQAELETPDCRLRVQALTGSTTFSGVTRSCC